MKRVKHLNLILVLLASMALFGQDGELVTIDPESKRAYYTLNEDYKVELDGSFSGNLAAYYDNGVIEEKGTLDRNVMQGKWVKYNNRGDVVTRARFKDGEKHGVWKVWDGKGNLRMVLEYEDGKPAGVWKIFNADGTLVKQRQHS
jgi:antitoxin component YwqK of YwqJK toxin-antitoxin module